MYLKYDESKRTFSLVILPAINNSLYINYLQLIFICFSRENPTILPLPDFLLSACLSILYIFKDSSRLRPFPGTFWEMRAALSIFVNGKHLGLIVLIFTSRIKSATRELISFSAILIPFDSHAILVRPSSDSGSPDISWGELHSLSWNIYRYYNRLVQAWKLIRKRSCHICISVKADNTPAFTV